MATAPSMVKPRAVKILRIMDRLNVGGPAIHAILLTQHFNSQSWTSKLVYGQEGPREGNMLRLASTANVVPIYVPTLGRELHPIRDLISLWKVWRIIRQERPDVVHTHKSKAGVVGRIAARLANVPVIVHTFHGHVLHGYFSAWKNRLFITIERWLGRFTDHIIAVSPKVREDLLACQLAPADKIKVLYLGLDLQKMAGKPRYAGELRRELGISGNTPLIGIVARLVPIKQIHLFLDMAKIVLREIPHAHFVIAGDGELRTDLERLASGSPLRGAVHFLGFRDDVERIYSDLDVLCLTSANEGSPVSLIEGMAGSCAAVSTDVGGVSDVIRHEESGLLVPIKRRSSDQITQDLARQVVRLINDPALRERLGKRGKDEALSRFSIERLVADLAQLYLGSLSEKVL
jgi:glycosyltransferase involved in cell wall biosynthesis